MTKLFARIIMIFMFLVSVVNCSLISPHKNRVQKIGTENDFVEYRHYSQKDSKKTKGTIFIFPPTGGENILDILYADLLAKNNYEVFILKEWSENTISIPEYNLHNVFYGAAQKALNRLIPLAQSKRIGLLGTSVGALHASVSLTKNTNIKAGFLIAGGLPISKVIVHSRQKAMVDLKEKRYKIYKLKNDTQYEEELYKAFDLEPEKSGQTPTAPVAMVISRNDELVPYEYQEHAKNFFNAKKVYYSNLNHKYTIMKNGLFNKSRVLNFFNEEL